LKEKNKWKLFDLKHDPKELIDLYNEKKNIPIVKHLRKELRDILNTKADLQESFDETNDKKVKEILRSLGYVE
jgi:hypothetical protein